jgi:hypothetical protein
MRKRCSAANAASSSSRAAMRGDRGGEGQPGEQRDRQREHHQRARRRAEEHQDDAGTPRPTSSPEGDVEQVPVSTSTGRAGVASTAS